MRSPLRVFMACSSVLFWDTRVNAAPSPLLHDIPTLIEPFARLFINAILVCVIPLVTTSLIAGCAVTNSAKLGRLAGRSLTIILFYLVASAVFAGGIAFALFHYLSHFIGHGSMVTATSSIPAVAAPTFGSFLDRPRARQHFQGRSGRRPSSSGSFFRCTGHRHFAPSRLSARSSHRFLPRVGGWLHHPYWRHSQERSRSESFVFP